LRPHQHSLTAALFTLMLGLSAAFGARATPCEDQLQQARQRDGNTIIVSTRECTRPTERRITVSLQRASGAQTVLHRFRQSIDRSPTGGATLKDIDGDGFSELELTGACGSGSVCQRALYKLNAAGTGLFLLYAGGTSEVEVVSGYLIEGGKTGCCTWHFQAYKLPSQARLIKDTDLHYRIDVGLLDAAIGASNDGPSPDCRFTTKSANRWVVVAPPSKALEKVCEVYGPDYVLDKAR
jgi:hypothetical protein